LLLCYHLKLLRFQNLNTISVSIQPEDMTYAAGQCNKFVVTVQGEHSTGYLRE
jgi:hypothetical protein